MQHFDNLSIRSTSVRHDMTPLSSLIVGPYSGGDCACNGAEASRASTQKGLLELTSAVISLWPDLGGRVVAGFVEEAATGVFPSIESLAAGLSLPTGLRHGEFSAGIGDWADVEVGDNELPVFGAVDTATKVYKIIKGVKDGLKSADALDCCRGLLKDLRALGKNNCKRSLGLLGGPTTAFCQCLTGNGVAWVGCFAAVKGEADAICKHV